jgi:ABC-type transporter Mla subunit MlaD
MSRVQSIFRRLGLDPRAASGVIVLVAGTLLWALTFTNTIPKLFQGSTKTVKTDFASAEDIVPNDPVRINGVQVGTVGAVTPDPGSRGAMIDLELGSSAGPIYKNASASLRWRTALGANDAITLNPGTPDSGLLRSGTIPQSQTSDQIELDEITRTLHAGAVTGVQTMLGQLGPAFSNHLAPAATFSTLAQVAPSVATGVGALRGVATDTDLKNLVVQASQAAHALDVGQSASYTQQFVQSAATTLGITGANAANIRAILADAVDVLPRVTSTAANVDHTLYLADPLVAKLMPTAPSVAPTLAKLHPTVVNLDTLLHDATPLLHTLRPTVKSLAATAQNGVPVIDQLAPVLKQVDAQILPGLNTVSPETKRTVYEMIGASVAALAGEATTYDQNGHNSRLTGSVSTHVLDVAPCKIDFTSPSQIVTCETLLALLQQIFTPNQNIVGQYLAPLGKANPKLAHLLLKDVRGTLLGKVTGSGGAR